MRQVEVSAPTDATLFIAGESGTGQGSWWPARFTSSLRAQRAVRRRQLRGDSETLLRARSSARARLVHRRRGAATGLFELATAHPVPRRKSRRCSRYPGQVPPVPPGGQFRRLGAKAEIRVNVGGRGDQQGTREGAGDGTLRETSTIGSTSSPSRCRRARPAGRPLRPRAGRSSRNSTIGTGVASGRGRERAGGLRRHRWPATCRASQRDRASGDRLFGRTGSCRAPAALGRAERAVAAGDEADLVLPIGTTVEDAEKS